MNNLPQFLSILKEDNGVIPYKKALNRMTGSVLSSILLHQVVYWSSKNNWREFYKFNEPCNDLSYKKGDSWTEELGFTKNEFLSARSKISTKITKGISKNGVLTNNDMHSLVLFWRDSNNKTWYLLNTDLLGKCISQLYLNNQDSNFTFNTETTSESTTETTDNGIVSSETNSQDGNALLKTFLPSKEESNPDDFSSVGISALGVDLSNQIIDYYKSAYKAKTGNVHPILKSEQINRVKYALTKADIDMNDFEDWKILIDQWFSLEIKTDWNINHFVTGKIIENRFYESLY